MTVMIIRVITMMMMKKNHRQNVMIASEDEFKKM
jgi:hypothetical protein